MLAAFDVKALHAALDAQRQARGLSWSQVAREVSTFRETQARAVSASTITGLASRGAVEGDGVLQMLCWLGRTPESFVPGHPWATAEAAALPKVGPDRVLRFDARAIYTALDARRAEHGLTWAQVAREIGGVQASGLTRLADGGRVTFPGVMRIFAWLERPAASFTRASEW